MPGSVRTIDAIAPRYNPSDDSALIVERRKSNLVSQIQLPPSPAESDIAMRDVSPRESPSATTREERRITRHIDRGAPGDQAIFSDAKTPERKELAKRKSQYYGEVFAHREPNSSARERVTRESMIIADIRTNVIVSMACWLATISLTFSRLTTNIPLLPISPITSLLATNALKIPSSYPSPTLAACSLPATSILPTR